jgi:hypothetical protein
LPIGFAVCAWAGAAWAGAAAAAAAGRLLAVLQLPQLLLCWTAASWVPILLRSHLVTCGGTIHCSGHVPNTRANLWSANPPFFTPANCSIATFRVRNSSAERFCSIKAHCPVLPAVSPACRAALAKFPMAVVKAPPFLVLRPPFLLTLLLRVCLGIII